MYKSLGLVLVLSVFAYPVRADDVTLQLSGEFTEEGFLSNGSFAGSFVYSAKAPDANPFISNVGTFNLKEFEIQVFDAEANLVDTLTEDNSDGSISLSDMDPQQAGADGYSFFTTPDTIANGNAFYEYGALALTFDWPHGGDPNAAPAALPEQFVAGNFSSYAATDGFEGIMNPQMVASSEIKPVPESTASWGWLGLVAIALGNRWSRKMAT
jgi:hypothetical protein